MNKIALFLLCLNDESSAFWLFCYIVNYIMPKNFYSKSNQGIPMYGFKIEKNLLKTLAIQQISGADAVKVETFLDSHGSTMIIPLFINYLNFESLYEIWNRVLTEESVSRRNISSQRERNLS